MANRHMPSDEGGIDWRRLAADRNVSRDVARALWDHARATSPDDPAQAERAFQGMLEEAEAANATQEPGRETLVGSTAATRDPASLGAGKWTRVLLEDKGGKRAAPSAPTGKATAEELLAQLVAAAQAGNHAAALLAESDPETIIEALRELRENAGPGIVQQVMRAAGGLIERILASHGTSDPAASESAASPASESAASPASESAAGPASEPTPSLANEAAASLASKRSTSASPKAPTSASPTTPTGASAAKPSATAAANRAGPPAPASRAPAASTSDSAKPASGPSAPKSSRS